MNGAKFTASFLKSEFNCPGKCSEHDTPNITALIKWFKFPYVGVVSLTVLKQISYKASLLITCTSSVESTNK